MELFNSGAVWEAHEAWERIWLDHRGEARAFIQGLIQLAAALYHVERGNSRGAERLFRSSQGRLERYPEPFCGVHHREAFAVATRRGAAGKSQLLLTSDWRRAAAGALGIAEE